MARAGLYKTEVKKARDSLVAQGLRPSIEAVRAALGHTGSKSTIHRYLKELEAEAGGDREQCATISDALQHLVAQLATQLKDEAQARIAEAQAACDAALATSAAAAVERDKELRALRDQLQGTEGALKDERHAHATTAGALQETQAQVIALTERVAGLVTQVQAREEQVRSLEDKHQHARESLEHFRRSAKEQHEQEQQRHEHHVQALQVELRQAQDLLASKNQELLTLNRDNVRLTERQGQTDKALRALQREHQKLTELAGELPALRHENERLTRRFAEQTAAWEAERSHFAGREADWEAERGLWREREQERTQQAERLATIEGLLARLEAGRPSSQEPLRSGLGNEA